LYDGDCMMMTFGMFGGVIWFYLFIFWTKDEKEDKKEAHQGVVPGRNVRTSHLGVTGQRPPPQWADWPAKEDH